MREISFRGKPVSGDWVYGDLATSSSLGTTAIQEIEVEPETVGQYTGLKDKDDVKIFEGDIVSIFGGIVPQEIFVVTWGGYYSGWCMKNNKKEHIIPANGILCESMRITGNIHDNPELLNQ